MWTRFLLATNTGGPIQQISYAKHVEKEPEVKRPPPQRIELSPPVVEDSPPLAKPALSEIAPTEVTQSVQKAKSLTLPQIDRIYRSAHPFKKKHKKKKRKK